MRHNRDREHLRVPTEPWRARQPYSRHPGGGGGRRPAEPAGGRAAHGQRLRDSIVGARDGATEQVDAAEIEIEDSISGVYLEFESFPGLELALGSLEKRRKKDPREHIEVVAVRETTTGEGDEAETVQHATVFVPDDEITHFISQLEKYEGPTPQGKKKPPHANVYDRVANIRLAALRALWTDDASAYPDQADQPIWWEVWLRRTDGEELARLLDFAQQSGLVVADRRLVFDDRIVTLVHGQASDLALSLDVLGDIAELQRAKETPTFFVGEGPSDQAAWVEDLLGRLDHNGGDRPAVCILDTGVTRRHPLLEAALAEPDCHSVNPAWGLNDHHGHGTEMAGLALLGDLVQVLDSDETVSVAHQLESVKILPPAGTNDPDLYGAITAEAASRPEIEAPDRRRVFSMAVASMDARDRGQPTSWSAAVDALAAGRTFDPADGGLKYVDEDEAAYQRLFVVSAGNVDELHLAEEHLDRSDLEAIHDPGQAWNALTVGAYTDKVVIQDAHWQDWLPLAERGELSPWSTTSMVFQKAWPLKPDVVFEGGNIVRNATGDVDFPCDDLNLLTTYYRPQDKVFVSTWATSAAGALAARMCARILAAYPDAWPETVRALMVHSAEWTPRMRQHLVGADTRTGRGRLVQRYGYGVPNLGRALESASSAVTLLVEDSIRPFKDGGLREIHFHDLPWPRAVLLALGDAQVRVRVTLSYFIEPNPGRRGWQTRHRYQSHGLRFQVKSATESVDEFRKRLNKAAMDDGDVRPSASGHNDGWFLGPTARDRGSIHSDVLAGFAADIAERGSIAVFPVTGWWKEQKKRDRSEKGARYALIVSIETDDVDTDIWTSVASQIQVGTAIET